MLKAPLNYTSGKVSVKTIARLKFLTKMAILLVAQLLGAIGRCVGATLGGSKMAAAVGRDSKAALPLSCDGDFTATVMNLQLM
jgi:phosphate/sulfate permease